MIVAAKLSVESVVRVMRDKGYVVFSDDRKRYNLNLFGVRSKGDANSFDDYVGVMYPASSRWELFLFSATTDPGTYWRNHPMNVDGTAILKPGQYRGAYKVGKHRGYRALEQVGDVTVYRDDDRDDELDVGLVEQTGVFKINIHRAHQTHTSSVVNRWSAGCQVIADPIHFDFLMRLCTEAAHVWGNRFTYTLLEESDF